MLAKKTSRNQITLPKDIAKEFPDIDYFDIIVDERKIILLPVEMTPEGMTLEGIREKIQKLGIDENDVHDAVKWARKTKQINTIENF
ncbi:MAG: AbrB/MazE/SpoVT family DNA-binding domain-containing protein [Nitrospirae bacterium]|nr:AbrB/MazE/SpoVT family DNA-binding domain-containing protein [Nitrospirota bacterium]